MYNPVDVCWFDSTMAGAPTLPGNTQGAVIGVLDACLVNGFNSQTLTSLVVSGGVATATKTSHGFWDHTVVQITGATPADLNGKKRITYIDSSTFTFEAVGIANGTASGTITALMAPSGWTKTTVSTNIAYYTKPSPMKTPWALLVDDTTNGYATISGRHTNGSTFGGNGTYSTYIVKGTIAGAKAWSVYADGRSIYTFMNTSGSDAAYPLAWVGAGLADLIGFSNGNDNDCLLFGSINTVGGNPQHQHEVGLTSNYFALAPGVPAYRGAMRAYNITNSGYYSTLIDGSAGADGYFHCGQYEVWDERLVGPRGILPGYFSSMHDWLAVSHGTILTNPQYVRTPQLRDHRIRVLKTSGAGMVVIDITGPWYPADKYYGGYRIRGTAKKQGAVGRFPLALMVKDSGQIIRKTMSAADGSFAFNNIDYLYQGYTVVEYDGELADPLNAAIADLVTPEAMP